MGSAHPRQRPRSASQLSTGTFSNHAISCSQRGQRERGRTTESPRGQREMQTFRNEPMQAPTKAASAASRVRSAKTSLTWGGSRAKLVEENAGGDRHVERLDARRDAQGDEPRGAAARVGRKPAAFVSDGERETIRGRVRRLLDGSAARVRPP